MARNSRINDRQLKRVYWPSWRAAEKMLVAAGFSKTEADEKRKEIHSAVTGSECSSKDLNNRTLDEVLRKFAAISNPRDGKRQADLADGPCKRLRFRIREFQYRLQVDDSYVDAIAKQMRYPRRDLCDENQLRNILAAIDIRLKATKELWRPSQRPKTPTMKTNSIAGSGRQQCPCSASSNHRKTMNMNTKYTPGPWQIDEDVATDVVAMSESRDNEPIQIADCAMFAGPAESEECEANARLIAAAPDLLDACKEALKRVALLTPFTVEGCDPILEKATDAAAAEADKTREQLRAAIAKAEGNSRQNAEP